MGEGIAGLMSMTISHDTLIRLIRRRQPAAIATPGVLGVDDFAWKKDAVTVRSLLTWRGIRSSMCCLIGRRRPSRPGSRTTREWRSLVATGRVPMPEGGRNGAPDAVQIADRFHLLINVTTAMTRFFERKHDTLKHIYEQEKALDPSVSLPVDTEPPTKPPTVSQQQQQSRQARRQGRYDEVKKLHEQGVSQRAIAALVGLHRDTVHRYLQTAQLPEIGRPHRRSKLDPYKDYLYQRWSEGDAQRHPLSGRTAKARLPWQ